MTIRIEPSDRGRRLLWHGMLLFVLGLLAGLAGPHLRNPRMGLAAHLGGVTNGIFLLVLGLVWSRVVLSARQLGVAHGLMLFGTYGNWVVTLGAAVLGTSSMTPLAGAGHGGTPWQERFATVGFVAVGTAMLVASGLVLLGLSRRRELRS